MRKELNRPDCPTLVYRYWIDPIGDIPQSVWDTAKAQQKLWNDYVEVHDSVIERYDALKTSEFKPCSLEQDAGDAG